jgi:hypothetical protein
LPPSTPAAAPSGYFDDAGSRTSNSASNVAATTDDTTPGLYVGAGLTDTPKLYVNGTLVVSTYNSSTGTLTPSTALTDAFTPRKVRKGRKAKDDGGFGAGYLARVVGQRKAREIWFLCRRYDATQALAMGLVNAVVPLEDLERQGVIWAREVLQHSPTAIRCLKAAFNAETDGLAGIQELAGQATHLFYRTSEGQEGRNAFLEKRDPDFSETPWLP